MEIRPVKESDYYVISPLINEWWGGRNMSDMLPKLFFDHFQNTSYVLEENKEIVGFLIGFLSQTRYKEAYIHFIGVHPAYRQNDNGRKLYQAFFDKVKNHGVERVRCVTSPINKSSIAYHTKLGFVIEKGDKNVEGIDVHSNYDGVDQDRVLFVKKL